MKPSVLITGGAGFIGSHYVDLYQKKNPDHPIYIMDAMVYGSHPQNISQALNNGAELLQGRIEDEKWVHNVFETIRPQKVIHFAAETHVDHSIHHPERFFQTNILGTANLLKASLAFDVEYFHHISTDEVYGDMPLDSTRLFLEEDTLLPSSPYSASKASSDLLVLAYHRTYGLPAAISRCSNNYGPRQASDKFLPTMIRKSLAHEDLPVYGTGKNVRDWIYVTDHCEAVHKLVENPKLGEIYNIGANCAKSNLEMIELLQKLMPESPSKIRFVEDRKGHDLRYSMGYAKLEKTHAWAPQVSLEEGLRRTIESITSSL